MHRTIAGLMCGCALLVASLAAPGDSLLKEAAAEFRRAGAELEEIEQQEGAEVAAGEIALARRWIDEGFALLRREAERRAAVLAERLPVQLILIRAVLAAHEAEELAEQEGREAHELSRQLARLKARYDRLVLEHRGAQATDAFPRREGGD